jgi:hypothetical protein
MWWGGSYPYRDVLVWSDHLNRWHSPRDGQSSILSQSFSSGTFALFVGVVHGPSPFTLCFRSWAIPYSILGLGEKVFSERSSIVSHSKSYEGPTWTYLWGIPAEVTTFLNLSRSRNMPVGFYLDHLKAPESATTATRTRQGDPGLNVPVHPLWQQRDFRRGAMFDEIDYLPIFGGLGWDDQEGSLPDDLYHRIPPALQLATILLKGARPFFMKVMFANIEPTP